MSWFSIHNKRDIGQQKEAQAKQWLSQQGLKIIAENYHCKGGEIDLIAIESNGSFEDTLVFIEVKYRKQNDFGHPSEFVNANKQRHLIHCAQCYLQQHPQYGHYAMRFDVIGYLADAEQPEWIQNAFGI
ncbi:YraN family protein [Thiomicrorhabdus sediminis]|uniref:UPF0102 protein FE785_08410 n=1 Tax=Thiomicrorhabdus sediminis TaxID=2580412 RepID=A0A4P9K6F1_9GAMM|nr:YraN family protein [Thiomicrorhabdus sediminis]QCU90654.1 YraN family protein [Thiomicrorhabdus sediminis]